MIKKTYGGGLGGTFLGAVAMGRGNWGVTAMGGYRIHWQLVGTGPDGLPQVKITVKNKMTDESGTRIPFIGYKKGSKWTAANVLAGGASQALRKVDVVKPLKMEVSWTQSVPIMPPPGR